MEDGENRALAPKPVAMRPLSPTTLGPSAHRAPSAAQQGKPGSTGGPAMEGSDGPARAGSSLPGGKDLLEEWEPQRRDTSESWASSFSSQRTDTTNTTWSIATSTATDMTDLASPDVASRDDTFALEYASSHHHSNLVLAPANIPFSDFPQHLPFRGPSVSFADQHKPWVPLLGLCPDNPPASRHLRVEETTSGRPSLSRQSTQSPPATEPGAFSQRSPSPSSPSSPAQTRDEAGDTTQRLGDRDQTMPGSPIPPGPTTTEDERAQENETGSSKPGGDTPEETGPPSDDGLVTPNALSNSMCSEASGLLSNAGGPSVFRPDGNMVEAVCDRVLQEAFGVHLQELAGSSAVSATYESVSHCLDELSHIVMNIGYSNAGCLMLESKPGSAGSSTTPIRPRGGTANSNGSSGDSGGGGGNRGGSQKRPNGSDGAGSGDGAEDGSPGGGKRQKVLSALQSAIQTPGLRLSCPFRKRNPVRFNIRDFQSCAMQSFPDIPQLKRHVKNFHKHTGPGQHVVFCPRCKQDMGTKEAVDNHLAVANDRICSFQQVPSSADPEDGITSRIEDTLNGRKADGKIDSWESLWRLLFPKDALDVPDSDFVPPTELEEVYAQFKSERCSGWLQLRVQEGLETFGNGQSVHRETDNMVNMFQDYIDFVFHICRSETSGVTGRPRKPRTQMARQTKNLQSPGRLNAGGAPILPIGQMSISAPVGASADDDPFGNLEQSEMVMPQPGAGYEATMCSYAADVGNGLMGPVTGSSADGDYNYQPVTIPAAAAAHIQHRFPGLDHQLQPSGSGVDLNTAFANQQAAGFPTITPFGPQNAYQNMGFGQPALHLALDPPRLQSGGFSPSGPAMGPSFHPWHGMANINDGSGFLSQQ